jgi:two-component system NtrC family sensor kinase
MPTDDIAASGPIGRDHDNNVPEECGNMTHPESLRTYHARLKHGILICLFITYIVPVAILTLYFNYQFNENMRESGKLQLTAVAESQRNTIDLFMQKRVVNVFNLFHMKDFSLQPAGENMQALLENLIGADDAFVDVGLIDPDGRQAGYAGPYPHLRNKDYSNEKWYKNLIKQQQSYIITDLYMGLRGHPHFTVGVKQLVDGSYYVIRTSVYPDKLGNFIDSQRPGKPARGFLVNKEGTYQVVGQDFGKLLEPAIFVPDKQRLAGVERIEVDGEPVLAAYTWLKEVPWCLVMLQSEAVAFKEMHAIRNTMVMGAAALILGIMIFIWLIVNFLFRRARAVDQERMELKRQLYHAHKLVSVGQLAGGVAHEINNPLAIIESEAGIIRDMLDPAMGMESSSEDICKELDEIDKAVNRAKGITQKMLSFVRKTEPKLVKCNINQLLDDVIFGVKEQEFYVSDINLVRDYAPDLPDLYLDPDLMHQVFLNLINNAGDAVESGDTINLKTELADGWVKITIADTGKGMDAKHLEKVFMPFFTTKKVGKGTGLGLPISLNIIEGFGGKMTVESTPGVGTAFAILLPASGKPGRVKYKSV